MGGRGELRYCGTCGVEASDGRCYDGSEHEPVIVVPADVVELLSGVYDDRGVYIWLRGDHKQLGARPIDLIAAGRTDEVVAEIHRLRDGAFS